jgi:hypothetical protein
VWRERNGPFAVLVQPPPEGDNGGICLGGQVVAAPPVLPFCHICLGSSTQEDVIACKEFKTAPQQQNLVGQPEQATLYARKHFWGIIGVMVKIFSNPAHHHRCMPLPEHTPSSALVVLTYPRMCFNQTGIVDVNKLKLWMGLPSLHNSSSSSSRTDTQHHLTCLLWQNAIATMCKLLGCPHAQT